MREFAPFYYAPENTWLVIFKDRNETEWYVEVPDAGSQTAANTIARAMTEEYQQR